MTAASYWHDSQSSPFKIEHTAAAAADCEMVSVVAVVPFPLLDVTVSVIVSLTATTSGAACLELACSTVSESACGEPSCPELAEGAESVLPYSLLISIVLFSTDVAPSDRK